MTKKISQENVLKCFLSKLNSNEFSIFEIVGFIDPTKVKIGKRYYYRDEKGVEHYPRNLPEPSKKEGYYAFQNRNGRCKRYIEDIEKRGYQRIEKRTRAGVHRAIDKLNAKFSSSINSKERECLITKPKDNLFVIDELKFLHWLEEIITKNYDYSDKEEFLRWLRESILHKDVSLSDLSKGAFYTKSKTGNHPLLLINPVVILNRVYMKDGKVNLKMKSKEVYLRLLEFLIVLMSQKYEFHSKNTPKHPKYKVK